MSKPVDVASLSNAAAVDSLSDRFEGAWKAGQQPRIEDYLALATAELRAPLLKALLEVEIELRGRSGRLPAAEEYRQRFSQDVATVNAVFATDRDARQCDRGMRGSALESQAAKAADASPLDASPLDIAMTVSVQSPDTDTSRMGDSPSPALSRGTIGRFEIKSVLGQGAFGAVYRARDPQLDRDVAVKVPQEGVLATPQDRERFVREARVAATLEHPGVCPVYEVGEEEGRPYIVMALIEGRTLDELLKSGKAISARQAANAVRKMALALDEAHGRGIVHRDLKPGNVMINRRGEPVIMDFGLARLGPQVDVQLTKSGTLMGTPAYMSPEQARGHSKEIGPATDIYSLGVILYELITRRRPFDGSFAEVLGQILHVEPLPPSSLQPEIAPELEAICLKAMAKAPAERYGSMKDFAQALGEYLNHGESSGTAGAAATTTVRPDQTLDSSGVSPAGLSKLFEVVTAQEQTQARRHRNLTWLVAGGLAAVVLALAGIWFFARGDSVTVVIQIPIDTNDPQLSFFLDERPITAVALAAPIELKPGNHELVVNKNDALFKKFRFHVGKGEDQRIAVRDVTPPHSRPLISEPTGSPPSSPLDSLNPRDIPAPERFPWQPDELVAVFGSHCATHWGTVRCLAVSPSGEIVASGGNDAMIHLSDAATKLIGTLEGHKGPVYSLAFVSRNQLISAGADGTLRLWDTNQRRESLRLTGHQEGVLTVAVTPDGTRALSGGQDATIRLWDLTNGKELRRFDKATKAVWKIVLTADGQRVLSGGDDRKMRFWRLETGEDLVQFDIQKPGNHEFRAIAISPDGTRAFSGTTQGEGMFSSMRIWDTATGKNLRRTGREYPVKNDGHGVEITWPGSVVTSPDGAQVLSGIHSPADGNDLIVWDIRTGDVIRRYGKQATFASAVAFSPDGKRAYTGSLFGRLKAWEAATGRDLSPSVDVHESYVASVALAPDSHTLLTGGEDLTVRLWKTSAPQRQLRVYRAADPWAAYSSPWHVGFSPDGTQALLYGGVPAQNFARLWNVQKWSQIEEHLQQTDTPITSALFHPKGWQLLAKFDRGLALTNGFEGLALCGPDRAVTTGHDRRLPDTRRGTPVVQAWDLSQDRILKTITPFPGFMGVAASRTRAAVTQFSDGAVKLYNSDLEQEIELGAGIGPAMAFSPGDDLFAAANAEGRITMWSLTSGKLVREFKFPGRVHSLGFDRSGKYLVTGNANGTAYLLRL